MAEASQEMCAQSVYRNGHFNSRYNNHHSEYSQYSGGQRRSVLNGSFGTSRRHSNFSQHNSHPRPVPGIVREIGLILEVHNDYGRVLSLTNFMAPNIHIYFSPSTKLNSETKLGQITQNLADLFQVGETVEIEFEGSVDPRDLRGRVHVILTCNTIKPTTEAGHEPELVPMIVIQDAGDVPLALIANHELVALPRQIIQTEDITSAFLAKKNEVTVEIGWPEFAYIGRSVEGRILNAPAWMHECINPSIKKIALCLQRYGRDREGFAVVKEYIGQGVVLKPIDEEDRRICGDLFFPYEMRTDVSLEECQDTYRIGSKWYFRACLELPNRKYKYRVYCLNGLEDAIVNDSSSAAEQNHEEAENPSAVTNEVPSAVVNALSNAVEQSVEIADPPSRDSEEHLIDLETSDPLQPVPVASTSHTTTVSPAILSMLSTVDFHAVPAASNGLTETALLDSSPNPVSPNTAAPLQSDLLLDFDDTSGEQQAITQVRHFHVLDEKFVLSSFNFDFKNERKTNYGAEMCGCSDQENSEDVCESPKKMNLLLRNTESEQSQNGTSHILSQKEQEMLLKSNGPMPTSSACKPIKQNEDLFICDEHFTIEQNRCNVVLPNTEEEVDTSDDDSENEMFHAVRVERLDNGGWWFTRKPSNGTNTDNEKKVNDVLCPAMNLLCNDTLERNALEPSEEKLLMDLSDDHLEMCEPAMSAAAVFQPSLSNALREDDFLGFTNDNHGIFTLAWNGLRISDDLLSVIDLLSIKSGRGFSEARNGSSCRLVFILLRLLAVYRAYERALAKRPFITQALSAATLAATADVLTQNIAEKQWQKGEYSPARTVRFATVILFWIAPLTYRWFLLLEKLKGTPSLLPLKRMIIDQSCAAPTFTFTFITNLHLMEGHPPREALNKAMKDIVPIMKTNYKEHNRFRYEITVNRFNRTVPVNMKRISVSIAIFSPPFTATYILRLMEGESTSETCISLKRDYLEIYTHSLMFWPTVQLCNFY